MTEFELWEAFASFNSVLHAWITTYFTTLTAYIIAAYVVGANLTRFQVVVINFAFIWFCGLCAYAAVNSGMRCVEFGEQILSINPSTELALSAPVITVASVIIYGGIVIALLFMWQVRHPKTE